MSIKGTLGLFDTLGINNVNLGPDSTSQASDNTTKDTPQKEPASENTPNKSEEGPEKKGGDSKESNKESGQPAVKAKVKKKPVDPVSDENKTPTKPASVEEPAEIKETSKPVTTQELQPAEEKSSAPVEKTHKRSSTQLGDVHIEVPETPRKGKEKLSVHKTYMTTPERAKRLEEIAAARGESVNALLNEIFKQLLGV